jgi:glucans biosynthesis protein
MFLSGGAALAAAATLNPGSANAYLSYGPPVRFNWESLVAWADALAVAPFAPAAPSDPDLIQRIDYDAYHQIRYRPDAAIWPKPGGSPVELFHVGRYFKEPVRVFVVNEGQAREVNYNSELFSYGRAEFARTLPADTGFAGFRVMHGPNEADWLSFLGASYFRSPGETKQYGLSTRGLALNTGMPEPEEFPRFTNFWIAPLDEGDGVMIYALLESPSVTGAYRIKAMRGQGVTTDVECVINARGDVKRLGIAPLTSMFWYGKNNRIQGRDWRPEIHDSDGLSIWTGTGERIWRPLNNPPVNKLSSFVDKAPKGFGLLQRDRSFESYEDDNVFYNRRPSVWVEPLGDWGEGAVQLLENTTDDETKDNIVAFWNPKQPFTAGQRLSLRYRVHWRNDMPFPDPNARVVATRTGLGGMPGGHERESATKYVLDFEGGILGDLTNKDDVKLVVTASRGTIDAVAAYRVVDTPRWRAIFDFHPEGKETADLRAFLGQNGKALTETWMYQHVI